MKIVIWLVQNIERYLAITFIFLMVIILFVQVICRYIFQYSITWSEELAVIFFILSVYTSASLAVTRRQHLKIALLQSKLSPKRQKLLDLFSNGVFAFVVLVLGYGMYAIVANLHKYHVKYIATSVPKYWVYGFIWLCFYLMVIRLIQDSIKLIKEYRQLQSEESKGN